MTEKYLQIEADSLFALLESFVSQEELTDFLTTIVSLGEEVRFLNNYSERVLDTDEKGICCVKAIVAAAFFFQENIELIRELIAALKYKTLDKPPPPPKKSQKKPKDKL